MNDLSDVQTTAQRVNRSALRLFASKGFQATGIREIAEEAGMSSAALYHYMGTKEQLLFDIMNHALNAWYAATAQAVNESTGPSEKLCNCIRAHVVCSGIFKLESTVVDTEIRSLTGENLQTIVALRDRYEGLMNVAVSEGIDRGEFSVDDKRLFRLAILEMCNGVSRWFSRKGPCSIEQISDRFADIGLAAASATRRGKPMCVETLDVRPCSDLVKLARFHFEATRTE